MPTNPKPRPAKAAGKMKKEMPHRLTLVRGVTGMCVYINNFRVCGEKPWGGGKIVAEWPLTDADLCGAGLRRA